MWVSSLWGDLIAPAIFASVGIDVTVPVVKGRASDEVPEVGGWKSGGGEEAD
jgi:hypothetical protein